MMGPLLFIIYINNVDENVVNIVGKFADDIKIAGVGNKKEEYLSLQQDL